jgi:hypothetical protein
VAGETTGELERAKGHLCVQHLREVTEAGERSNKHPDGEKSRGSGNRGASAEGENSRSGRTNGLGWVNPVTGGERRGGKRTAAS